MQLHGSCDFLVRTSTCARKLVPTKVSRSSAPKRFCPAPISASLRQAPSTSSRSPRSDGRTFRNLSIAGENLFGVRFLCHCSDKEPVAIPVLFSFFNSNSIAMLHLCALQLRKDALVFFSF